MAKCVTTLSSVCLQLVIANDSNAGFEEEPMM